MNNAIKGIDIVTYLVQDAERAIAFYRDTLGLHVSLEYGGQGAEFELADGTTFGLWKLDANSGEFRPSGGVMFAVDDCRAKVAELQSRGVTFFPTDHGFVDETPACFMAFAVDTEGNSFVVHQRKQQG